MRARFGSFFLANDKFFDDDDEDHQGESGDHGRDEKDRRHDRRVPQDAGLPEGEDETRVTMNEEGQGDSDQAEKFGPFHVALEHKVSVNHAVHRIESEKKRPPGDRGGDPQIEKEVPEPEGLLKVDEQDHGSDHQQKGGHHHSDLADRLKSDHSESIGHRRDDEGPRTQAGQVEVGRDGDAEGHLMFDIVDDIYVHFFLPAKGSIASASAAI